MEIPTNKYSGYIFLPAKVKANVPAGNTFVGWRNLKGEIISTDSVYEVTRKEIYIEAYYTTEKKLERPIRINEVSADNSVFINESFKKRDWIELYNATSNRVDVGGMYLSDKLSNPEKWTIPSGTVIPARGYLIIWCDKEEGTQLHAPFKLDNKAENAIVLTSRDKSWADTLIYRSHTPFQSVGLYPDGGCISYVMNRPTIGKANRYNSYDLRDREIITGITTLLNTPKNEIIYNLLGQPVTQPQPGQLYIKNGRKFYYRP